jgi:hypothetical protein
VTEGKIQIKDDKQRQKEKGASVMLTERQTDRRKDI